MSGHSKWHSIKHKKAAADAKRGKVFSKIVRELSVAARAGGGDADANPRLRAVILKAKAVNMPADNIDKAVKKGTGELPGVSYEEVNYEGYGPGGAAILVSCLTDNRNRTASEIRNIFDKKNGRLAGAGSVAWNFVKKGIITVGRGAAEEDDLLALVLDAGAEDFRAEGPETYEIQTEPESLEAVKKALERKGVAHTAAEVTLVPKSTVKVAGRDAEHLLELVEALEDHDDVQNVSSNFDIPDDVLEAAGRR
ncbi:MAG: YebC/PmpR family DNA-binding transcriptional regulator [bacterium]|nr:YebC/PmpR family DNA-binding transcriptional regulator [bacterium]